MTNNLRECPSLRILRIRLTEDSPFCVDRLQNWAQEKYAANATAPPFNHFFYAQVRRASLLGLSAHC